MKKYEEMTDEERENTMMPDGVIAISNILAKYNF